MPLSILATLAPPPASNMMMIARVYEHTGQNQGHRGYDSAKQRIHEIEIILCQDSFDKSSKPTSSNACIIRSTNTILEPAPQFRNIVHQPRPHSSSSHTNFQMQHYTKIYDPDQNSTELSYIEESLSTIVYKV